MSDKVIYGIDLGTTYSCLAKMDPMTQQPKVIEDTINGTVSLPSAVAFPMDQEGVIVGAAAKEIAFEHPERVFQFFKRYIGREDAEDMPTYEVGDKQYSPVDLSAIVLEQIKRYASQQGEDLEDVIITVPAYFSLNQRAATKDAGRIAGLNVLATINEPTAAALAFAHGNLPENRLMLVYDLGGGTFDVTMVRLTPTDNNGYRAEVIATDGNFMLGGYDWDERMFGLLKQKYAEENGCSEVAIAPEDLNELRGVCEQTKQALSARESCTVRVAGVKLQVTRDEFNAATEDLLQQTVDLVEAVLGAAREKFGIGESDITDVLMVGGSTKMKQVIDMLNNRFGEDRVRFGEPERAVAMGAAVASELMSQTGMSLDEFNDVVIKLGLGKNDIIKVGGSGGVTVTDSETGRERKLSEEEKEQLGLGKTPGGTFTIGELQQIQQNKTGSRGEIVDVVPSTFGLIILKNGEHRVDNVIKKGDVTGMTVSRQYATPGGNYTMLQLPVVQSDSQNEDDPCLREGNDYIFPGSTDRHQEVGRLEIPVPAALPEETEVDVDVSFDNLANLRILMRIPSADIEKKLEVNFGTSDEEIARKRQAHNAITIIGAL